MNRPIVFVTNKKYLIGTTIAVGSAILNNDKQFLDIYIVYDTDDISQEDIDVFLKKFEKYSEVCKISFVYSKKFQELKNENIFSPENNQINHYWTKEYSSIWLKVFIHEALPNNIKECVFIDSDIAIFNNLSDLLSIDLKSPIAACLDRNWFFHLNWNHPVFEYFDKNIPVKINKAYSYFNSGVMVIDLPYLRKIDLVNILVNNIKQKLYWHSDQDFLNDVFVNNWQAISPFFNFIISDTIKNNENSNTYYEEIIKNSMNILSDKISLLHFTFIPHVAKPWSYDYDDQYKVMTNQDFNIFHRKYFKIMNIFNTEILETIFDKCIGRYPSKDEIDALSNCSFSFNEADKRISYIKQIYLDLLNRDFDTKGFCLFYNENITEDEIKNIIICSEEFKHNE